MRRNNYKEKLNIEIEKIFLYQNKRNTTSATVWYGREENIQFHSLLCFLLGQAIE